MGDVIEETRASTRAWVGRFLGPVAALLAYFLLPTGNGGLSPEGAVVVAVGLLMAIWWVTEALPLPATALLPIVLFPLFGAVAIEDATAPYASDVIFLFMGGFMIALAMQRWGLHRRIALVTIMAVGTQPVRVIGGFMIATAFLSMWVSNTATAVMMLPIGLSVLALVITGDDPETGEGDEGRGSNLTGLGASNFAVGLMLGIAYAASIGSLATLIGTPPNLFMAGFLQETYDITIGFGEWMLVGLPLSVVFLFITWIVLTRFVYPPEISEISGGRELIRGQLDEMGRISRGEKIVLVVFVTTAFFWIFRQALSGLPGLGGLEDSSIAIAAAIALFFIPVDARNGVFALDWRTALNLPWGVLLLFGGGLSLASAVSATGVDQWIGDSFAGFAGVPILLFVVAVTAAVIFLTELTSNTATAAALLPIFGGVAVGTDLDPLLLVVPAALAASCAFMLPVATPPNAIVFGSGHVTILQMVKAGIWLNVIGIVLITLTIFALATWIFGITLA
ncbi:DASS family sodium-coupled anion symporter [Rubrobacter indicoceani]|uniref:SLC13 family permease n=1 Tax=Rubrobacter indicoceani TaxID=2051957 RepID=UPI000E5B183A